MKRIYTLPQYRCRVMEHMRCQPSNKTALEWFDVLSGQLKDEDVTGIQEKGHPTPLFLKTVYHGNNSYTLSHLKGQTLPFPDFGIRLQYLMLRHHVSRKQLADGVGVSDSVISEAVVHGKVPRFTTVFRIAAVFGVQVHELFLPIPEEKTGEDVA